ncbi:MAG TPA: endonuclease/exonuclease/phosphatase [Chitinophagaceae bacterium]|nr:endonuclease/exonuclease/phosphatase [Chitinophagaceae bacterium]
MASRLRLFTKRFFIYANWLVVLLFLLSCLIPLLHPQQWWWVSMMGLSFPVLLLLVVCFFFGWLILLKFDLIFISLIALGLGYKSIAVFIGFNAPLSFATDPGGRSIRVVSWNVARFIELARNNNKGSTTRKKMLSLLKEQRADVLCLQEFYTSENPEFYDNIRAIQQTLGFRYYYFPFDKDGDRNYYSSIIFSKFPIVDSSFLRYPRPSQPEALVQADIKIGPDTIRFFTTHLQSQRFDKIDYWRMQKIKSREDSLVYHSIPIVAKLKRGIVIRSMQADIIDQVRNNSPYPVVITGDLNDVPNSYTYFKVRGSLKDAFLEKGYGIGRTFRSLSPTLRIDYIFTDSRFSVVQFKREKKDYSDHYMIVADIRHSRP